MRGASESRGGGSEEVTRTTAVVALVPRNLGQVIITRGYVVFVLLVASALARDVGRMLGIKESAASLCKRWTRGGMKL